MRKSSGQTRLADEAFRQLEELIVTLRLPPGEVVTEPELAEMIGIGRTPTREAVQRLAAQGLVRVKAGKGLFITETNPYEHLALLEARATLEYLLARRAAALAGEPERQALEDCGLRMAERARAGDVEGFMRQDKDFDLIVARAARNRFASAAVAPMQTMSRRFWYAHHGREDLEPAALRHLAVMEAIRAQDPDAASAASDALLSHLWHAARRVVEAETASEMALGA